MDFSLEFPLLRFQGVANRSWSPACFHGGKLGGGNLDCSTWRLGFSCIEMEQHFRSPQTLKMLSTFIRAVRVYMGNKKQHQISRGWLAFAFRRKQRKIPTDIRSGWDPILAPPCLVGGWTNPFEKYYLVILGIFLNFRGDNAKMCETTT